MKFVSRDHHWRRQDFRLGGPHPPLSLLPFLLSLSLFPSQLDAIEYRYILGFRGNNARQFARVRKRRYF